MRTPPGHSISDQIPKARFLPILVSLFLLQLPLFAQGDHLKFGNPGGHGQILDKEFFVICHDNTLKIPQWVGYHLKGVDAKITGPRVEDFRADEQLDPTERSELKDYKRSGFDRGHMAPANDFKRSKRAMSATFVLSNMCPQKANLNRKIWKKLEADVHKLAIEHGNVWTFTGPLFLDSSSQPISASKFIGPDRVAVPTHFFKVVLCEHESGTHEMFAFIMQNRARTLTGKPKDYMVTVDKVEAESGFDFFSTLPDSAENALESIKATNWPIH